MTEVNENILVSFSIDNISVYVYKDSASINTGMSSSYITSATFREIANKIDIIQIKLKACFS